MKRLHKAFLLGIKCVGYGGKMKKCNRESEEQANLKIAKKLEKELNVDYKVFLYFIFLEKEGSKKKGM